MKCVQLKDSLSPQVTRRSSHPHSTGPAHSLKENRKKKCTSGQFFPRSEIFAYSARTQHRGVTLKRGFCWLPSLTPQKYIQPPSPSALLEVVHANCLVYDTPKDRITWEADRCNRPENHHRHRLLETQWNTASALWLKVWPPSCNTCCLSYNASLKWQKLQPQLESVSKMLRENVAISIWTKSTQR